MIMSSSTAPAASSSASSEAHLEHPARNYRGPFVDFPIGTVGGHDQQRVGTRESHGVAGALPGHGCDDGFAAEKVEPRRQEVSESAFFVDGMSEASGGCAQRTSLGAREKINCGDDKQFE